MVPSYEAKEVIGNECCNTGKGNGRLKTTGSKQEARTVIEELTEGIRAVIFDLDGTLIDSMWMWKQIDIDYLARHGHQLPEDLQDCIEGMSFSETAVYFKERFSLSDPLDVIKADWNRMAYDIYVNEVPLKPGVWELLQYLREHGIRTGIATSNSKELLLAVLKSLGITEYFDELHTSCEVKRGKPAPDIYLLVAERLGVGPEQCLVFEDIIQGIYAGKAAGMKVCAVKDEFSVKQEPEKKASADRFISSFTELMLQRTGDRNEAD